MQDTLDNDLDGMDDEEDLTAADDILLTSHIVRAKGIRKTFHRGQERIDALQDIEFSVLRGEYVAIMGPSGSGKTTLFNMIGGLDRPDAGRVFIDEVDIAALDSYELAWLRCHKIGYIFQTFNLIKVASALDNKAMDRLRMKHSTLVEGLKHRSKHLSIYIYPNETLM